MARARPSVLRPTGSRGESGPVRLRAAYCDGPERRTGWGCAPVCTCGLSMYSRKAWVSPLGCALRVHVARPPGACSVPFVMLATVGIDAVELEAREPGLVGLVVREADDAGRARGRGDWPGSRRRWSPRSGPGRVASFAPPSTIGLNVARVPDEAGRRIRTIGMSGPPTSFQLVVLPVQMSWCLLRGEVGDAGHARVVDHDPALLGRRS